ncbi:hypothetical protein E0Z10_g4860 [Xylaria hypoxylon]|uniref:Uncharacterized protein n=1 Tax=Xylaria hypoxylon TaxID=37992 RepID=A0A4Z0YJ78_9PEZI|nr:hypothetical protein E0Z10_g4860 [Xylaria hypoxylon]
MDESLKKYLGTQKSAALEKFLDDLTSKPEAKRSFVGFGVWPCDDNYRHSEVDVTGNNDSLCTHVVISVKGVLDRRTAEDALRKIDREMDVKLSAEQKPPRVSYCLDDDSNTQYRAKSCRIRGTLPTSSETPEDPAHEEGGSVEATPPASPRGGYVVKTEFVEVRLGSEEELWQVATPSVTG